jgi:hypothetical protein
LLGHRLSQHDCSPVYTRAVTKITKVRDGGQQLGSAFDLNLSGSSNFFSRILYASVPLLLEGRRGTVTDSRAVHPAGLSKKP